MSGVVVFTSVRDALKAGYHIYGRTEEGYLARIRTQGGWALALVVIAKYFLRTSVSGAGSR